MFGSPEKFFFGRCKFPGGRPLISEENAPARIAGREFRAGAEFIVGNGPRVEARKSRSFPGSIAHNRFLTRPDAGWRPDDAPRVDHSRVDPSRRGRPPPARGHSRAAARTAERVFFRPPRGSVDS